MNTLLTAPLDRKAPALARKPLGPRREPIDHMLDRLFGPIPTVHRCAELTAAGAR